MSVTAPEGASCLTTCLARPLTELGLRVVMIDGVAFHDHAILVALGLIAARKWCRTDDVAMVNEVKPMSANWGEKGATLTHQTALKEFGLSETEIFDAIRAGTLQYRETSIHGNPALRLLRREVEKLAPRQNLWVQLVLRRSVHFVGEKERA